MQIDEVREYCLDMPEVTESFPFGEDTLVFKVAGKMFCISNLERFPPGCNLKCAPERALDLRDEYEGIEPGWHMNKKHWNTVRLDGLVPGELIAELIDHSYVLVVKSLKKADRVRVLEKLEARHSAEGREEE